MPAVPASSRWQGISQPFSSIAARHCSHTSRICRATTAKVYSRSCPRAAKRELIDTGTDKRYVRWNPKGQFKESDDVGRSLSADRRRRARKKAKRGQGDKGDR
jgi:hypothetical protein